MLMHDVSCSITIMDTLFKTPIIVVGKVLIEHQIRTVASVFRVTGQCSVI